MGSPGPDIVLANMMWRQAKLQNDVSMADIALDKKAVEALGDLRALSRGSWDT